MKVTIVDYGSSNLKSVQRGFSACGAEIELASRPEQLLSAERLVLPGVGSFSDCGDRLRENHLDGAIREHIVAGRPFLGICVGMQMLFDASEEHGLNRGLGAIAGTVKAIPSNDAAGRRKIPHIGWRTLTPAQPTEIWVRSILNGIGPEDYVYFVHSYSAWPENEGDRLADADHDGARIAAAVNRENIYGCQFHPEKSGPVGLRILTNFLAL